MPKRKIDKRVLESATVDPKNKPYKVTMAEKSRRVLEIYNLLLSGRNRPTILEYSRTKWSLSRSETDNYMKEAREMMAKSADAFKAEGLKGTVERRMMLFTKALDDGDFDMCHVILADLDKLLNRYPSEKHRVQIEAARGLADLLNGKPLPDESGLKKD